MNVIKTQRKITPSSHLNIGHLFKHKTMVTRDIKYEAKRLHTRYQIFTQTRGITSTIVGQAFVHVTTTIMSKLKYNTSVILKRIGIIRSTAA